MKILFVLFLGLSGLSVPPAAQNNDIPVSPVAEKKPVHDDKEKQRLESAASLLRSSIRSGNFCEQYCFMADMSIHSGKKRFYVYDLEKDSVLIAGLVAHGSGSESAAGKLQFSNEEGSLATSLGRYRIGQEYNGQYGLAFKLTGLDKTNNHAYARAVVLHSHRLVQEEEIWPEYTCLSWGCPTVSPAFLLKLKKYINDAGRLVMLYIFY